MTIQESERYLRRLFGTQKSVRINKKVLDAVNCVLEAATHQYDDEIGFRAFCRLWLYQMLHYDTVPWDEVIQKEFGRSLLKSTQSTMDGISRTMKDAEVERQIESKTILTLDGFNRIMEIRKKWFTPEELERNLRLMYAQIKFTANV